MSTLQIRLFGAFSVTAALASRAVAAEGAPAASNTHTSAIAIFLIFVVASLFITYRASQKGRSAAQFYAAGSNITPFQNGFAIAGDFMSAAAFLGLSALIYVNGFDIVVYLLGFGVGWPIVLFLISERLRNLGLYTLADATSFRLDRRKIRVLTALGSLTVVAFYLVAQLVGAGQVVQLLFGLEYNYAVVIVCVLTIVYVIFGGMSATTWVQIIKAFMLLAGGIALAATALSHFGFNFNAILESAAAIHPKGLAILSPGPLFAEPIGGISLGIALMFGTAGLPHILMRFYTVPNANGARKSVFYATCFITSFTLIIPVIGYAAVAILMRDPQYFTNGTTASKIAGLIGGPNMVALHLANAMGGPIFFGFIAAVAFATILAVVSGLTLAGASSVSHDLYGEVFARGKPQEGREVFVSKLAAVGIGVLAGFLSIQFRHQNVAFMAGIALAVAASCNFPVLLMSLYWRGLTTRGALAGGVVGLASSVLLIVLSKTVWVDVFHFANAVFPYENPSIFSMPAAFVCIWLFSVTDRSSSGKSEREAFSAQLIRSEIGAR